MIQAPPTEEAPELISPRISFSHDLANFAAPPRRSDASLLVPSSRLPEPEFDFANANAAAAADVAPADRLFTGGKLLPVPPLPPAPRPSPCKQEPSGGGISVEAQACPQKRPAGSWASPFSRSSSVNSATSAKTTTGAPRSAGRFGCPPFPLMRSRSASAAVARDGGLGAAAVPDAAGHRLRYYKKFGPGGTVAPASNGGGGGSSRAYYYGGSRKGSSHGVRVSPVLNVPLIGTSVANVLSYLLCDCSTKTKKSRGF
ncbi:translation initiation factor IF-2-like [Panicum miliaceum]|uniref:Translation initiation factor IF-2-like n=1 Tax=Panicum miliaceum TaxID=4540 RepID=A0A3L6SLX4_PANMI|nr:translation initiation factor IF-2-like [Panicum miliaceum]